MDGQMHPPAARPAPVPQSGPFLSRQMAGGDRPWVLPSSADEVKLFRTGSRGIIKIKNERQGWMRHACLRLGQISCFPPTYHSTCPHAFSPVCYVPANLPQLSVLVHHHARKSYLCLPYRLLSHSSHCPPVDLALFVHWGQLNFSLSHPPNPVSNCRPDRHRPEQHNGSHISNLLGLIVS